MNAVQSYDLAIAWTWEYDRDFVECIRDRAKQSGAAIKEIHPGDVKELFDLLAKGEISFRHLLDRASDEDESYQPLARYIHERFRAGDICAPRPINPLDLQARAADKATMHLEFMSAGIEVPYTIIISPYNHVNEIELSLTELAKLGRPFIIKPANTTGGGMGVVKGAETLKEVIEARQVHKNDKYLLQETVRPSELEGRRAWFRVFYAFGEVIPCWWDDLTHIYSPLTKEEEERMGLQRLREITRRVQSVCRLEFFSTELVHTVDGRCIAVDYVNEICDMRFRSKCPDGVPDEVVSIIVDSLIEYVQAPR
jgi:hypothetical protein